MREKSGVKVETIKKIYQTRNQRYQPVIMNCELFDSH